MQIVGREQPPVVVQVVHARLERASAIGHMPASRGSLLPLRRLQGEQAVTTFSQVVWPPCERGMQVVEGQILVGAAILAGEAVAQEDVEPREGRDAVDGLTKVFSETTLGSRISKLGLCTALS